MKILAIIPARSGSKSIKDKNICLLNGKPMLAYSIEQALASTYINRVIVSTDSLEYANLALEYGAEVPFLRPEEYARDESLDLEVFQHALSFLKAKEQYIPEIVVQLRPTHPIRDVKDIDYMIKMMLDDKAVDSVRAIVEATEIPHKMWYQEEDQRLVPIITTIPEAYNMPRQQLPKVYYQNASIDVIRTSVISEGNSMSGSYIQGFRMKENYDIDTEEELDRVRKLMDT